MPSWTDLLEKVRPEEHLVQLYGEDDRLLARHVGRYALDGLQRSEGVLIIAIPDHSEAIASELRAHGADPDEAVHQQRMLFLDAAATLERFMVKGQPDHDRLRQVVRSAIGHLRSRPGCTGIRAFGEVVGLLWTKGNQAAAIRLEEHWNELIRAEAISLFCAYPIDALGGKCDPGTLESLVGAHTHVLIGPRTMISSAPR